MNLVARLVVVVLLAILPTTALVVWNELRSREERVALAEAQALQLTRFAEGDLDRLVDAGRVVLAAAGTAPAVRGGDPAACAAQLRAILEGLPQFVGIGTLDTGGRFSCWASRSAQSPPGTTAPPWWRETLERDGFVVNGHVRGGSGLDVLVMSQPLRDADGGVLGVVAVAVDLRWLNDVYASRGLPTGASVGIADRNGIFLVRFPANERLRPGMPVTRPELLELPAPTTVTGVGPDGIERVVGLVPPRATASGAFIVSVGLPRAALMAPLEERTRDAAFLLGVAIGISLLLTALGGRRMITEPVGALARAAERWRAGDLEARTGITGEDELGRLARTFDTMAESVAGREQALRESDARFRGAIEKADVPIMFHAEDGEILAVSRGLLAATGWTREEIGDFGRWCELAYGEQAQAIGERVARRFAEGEGIPAVEREVRTRDGRRLAWVWHAAPPERLPDGRRYLVAIAADVSARKAAEAFAQKLADASPAILYVFDLAAGQNVYVNEAAARILGYTADEIGAMPSLLDLVHPDDLAHLPDREPRRADDPAAWAARVYRMRAKDGSWRWLQGKEAPFATGPDGTVTQLIGSAIDITALKQAEEALQQSRERLQLVLGAAEVGLWEWDFGKAELFWDGAQRALYGVGPDFRPTFQAVMEFIHPDDREAVRQRLRDAAATAGGRGYRGEHRVVLADGSVRWILSRAVLERDAQGRLVAARGINLDITDRKAAEEALREARARLDLVLGAAQVGLWEWDVASDRLTWDGAQHQLFGVGPDFVPTYGAVLQMLPAEDRERTLRLTEEAASRGDPGFDNAYRVVRPDGEVRWLLGRTVLVRDEAGKVTGARGVNLDITRARRAEQDLERSRERLALALAAGGMGLWDWDMQANELFWDEGQRRLYGLGPDDPVSLEVFSAMMHPDDVEPTTRAALDALLGGAETHESEFRIRRRDDGAVRWILARTAILRDAEGRVLRQSGVNLDITERKTAAERLAAAERRVVDILESASDGFVGIDRDWRFTYANRAALAAMPEPDRRPAPGRGVWEAWAPMLGTELERAYRAAMTERRQIGVEHRDDGDPRGERWHDVKVFPTEEGIGVFFRDITGRKRAERELARLLAELEAERARFLGIVEASPAGIIFARASDGRMVYANPQAARILGGSVPLSEDASAYERDYTGWHADGRPIGRGEWPLERALAGETVQAEELRLLRADGREAWVRAGAAPLQDGSGAVVVFADIDAEKRAAESLRSSEERLRLALDAGGLGTFYVEPRRGLVVWDEGLMRLFGIDAARVPRTIDAFVALVHPDDREAVRRQIEQSRDAGGEFRREFRLATRDGSQRWIAERGSVRKDASGRVAAITGVNWDVTERRLAQERQELLMRELDHRVKNILAVVQVIAQQSGRAAADLPAFLAAFAGRIQAMATAHEMLAASQWAGARLPALARAALAHWLDGGPPRVDLALPDVLLPPQTAQNLALVLHELATNASKHGALSVPEGRVALAGEIEGREGAERLTLTWAETGGPPVAEPVRKGFGSTLLRRALTYAEGGEVALAWKPEGLVWHALLPLGRSAGTGRAREG